MSAPWLSDEWVAATSVPVATVLSEAIVPTVTAPPGPTVAVTVTGGPAGDVRYQRGAPGDAEPDVTFTVPVELARALLEGEADASVAFMRGRLKTAGDPGAVLAVLGAWSTPAGRRARDEVAALTDFG